MMWQRFFLALFAWRSRLGTPGFAGLAMVLALAGCSRVPAPAPPSNQPLPEQRAYFVAPPDALLDALPQICTAPTQRILRPAAGVIECRMLLPPDATAGAILRYGGTIAQLPESVIRLRLESQGEGYVLAATNYLEVPRAGGDVLRVFFPDPRIARRVARVMVQLGGTLL
ncbi:MAG: hypothetical protein ACU0B7_06875 [Paracoccaceae bacterium]